MAREDRSIVEKGGTQLEDKIISEVLEEDAERLSDEELRVRMEKIKERWKEIKK